LIISSLSYHIFLSFTKSSGTE